MNRTALGIVALLLLAVGGITSFRGPPDGSAVGFAAGCIRVGLVLAALWLALPQILALGRRTPRWLFGRFLGGNKPADPQKPAAPIKRPRRRGRD
jgi:hypothetical protein